MGKPTIAEIKERQEYWLEWRWEFTRDDPKYPEVYKDALELRKVYDDEVLRFHDEEWQQDLGQELLIKNDPHDHYLSSEQGKRETLLAKDFGLLGNCMIDPKMSYEDLMEPPFDSMEKRNFRPITFYSHFAETNLDVKTGKLSIEIDLTKVNSFDALPGEVKKIVDFEVNSKKLAHLRKKSKDGKGERFFYPGGRHYQQDKDFYNILLAGRTNREMLKKMQPTSKDHVPFRELADKLYPPQTRKNPNTDFRKEAETAFNDYKKLVNGGYREITYP